MGQRGYRTMDLDQAILGATEVRWQPAHESWLLVGRTHAGELVRLAFEVKARGIKIRTVLP